MRDAKSRVRDEKELVVYSGTRNQDHLQTTGCVGAVLGPVELVTCILVEWERRLIFNIFNIFNICFMFMFMYKGTACTRLVLPNIHLRGQPSKQ